MMDPAQLPNDERICFNYALWLPIYKFEKPYQIISDIPGVIRRSNVEFRPGFEPELVQDLRGQEHLYDIDSHGFKVVQHHSAVKDWSNRQAIVKEYIPEVERLIANELDEVDEVFVFNWRVRKNRPYKDDGIREIDLEDGSQYVLPANFVHIDQSPAAAVQEVQNQMGQRASELLRGRVRIINLWKSTSPHPVQDAPLALCDGTSMDETDFLTADHVRRKTNGETLLPVYRRGFRWHYLSHQKQHECYIFKIFDSLQGVQAKYCPHTSFQHRMTPPGCPPRESIEVRAMVFTYARQE